MLYGVLSFTTLKRPKPSRIQPINHLAEIAQFIINTKKEIFVQTNVFLISQPKQIFQTKLTHALTPGSFISRRSEVVPSYLFFYGILVPDRRKEVLAVVFLYTGVVGWRDGAG